MDNVIEKKSFDFAIRIVNLYKYLCDKKQAQSKADFISKLSIALKETTETKYWLKLLHATAYLNDMEIKTILTDCIEIEKILTSILKSTKK